MPDRKPAATLTDRTDSAARLNFLAGMSELMEHRARKVAAVRSAIADGTYQTPEKLGVAIDRVLEQLGISTIVEAA